MVKKNTPKKPTNSQKKEKSTKEKEIKIVAKIKVNKRFIK